MTDPVVILVPVLDRPGHVAPLVESITAATPEPHRVVFIATRGDTAQIDAIHAVPNVDLLQIDEPGTYVRKINAGFTATTEPLVFAAADDLRFHPGWYPAATAHLTDQIQVVGTNDLGNPRVMAGRHATHNLFTRDYIDRRGGTVDGPGLVMHDGYRHWYCDDEFVGTAQRRGVWAFAPDSHVEHLHPIFGKGEMDDTYILGRAHNLEDRNRYRSRRRLWMRERTHAG